MREGGGREIPSQRGGGVSLVSAGEGRGSSRNTLPKGWRGKPRLGGGGKGVVAKYRDDSPENPRALAEGKNVNT